MSRKIHLSWNEYSYLNKFLWNEVPTLRSIGFFFLFFFFRKMDDVEKKERDMRSVTAAVMHDLLHETW